MKKIVTFLIILSSIVGYSQKKITLVIDAGHGGTDPGNLRSDTIFQQEKDLNLSMALQFGKYVDMFKTGIIDPVKVERVALQNAISVASLLLTTEATVSDIKEDKAAAPAMPDMGGMGGMPGMM